MILFILIILFTIFLKFKQIRKFLSFLAIAGVIFPINFLLSNITTFSQKNISEIIYRINNPVPIFILIFDELPIYSLLDVNGNIDQILFPNFASLLENFTWFNDTTTVSESTVESIPSILTGLFPKKKTAALFNLYPNNLFSYLNNYYKIYAFENFTKLCPNELCNVEINSSGVDYHLFLSDVLVIYQHLIYPKSLSDNLPIINSNWKNFAKDSQTYYGSAFNESEIVLGEEKRDMFYSYLDEIKNNNLPALYYYHTMLPHLPYIFLPSGKIYDIPSSQELGIDKDNTWSDNKLLADQSYQRHLLQLCFTDKLLGKFILKLKEIEIFDEALIIILSDHGVNFTTNDKRRILTENNFNNIISIPLFIKLPNQTNGLISNRKTETIDILPTIFEVIEAEGLIKFDGVSILNKNYIKEFRKVYFDQATQIMNIDEKKLNEKKINFLKQKYTNLKENSLDKDKIYKLGEHSNLINRLISELYYGNNSDTISSINLESSYKYISLNENYVPSKISGYLFTKTDNFEHINLAVAVNGVIKATTKPIKLNNASLYWQVIVNENSFVEGNNKIDLYQIILNNSKIELLKILTEKDLYKIIEKNGKTIMKITNYDKDILVNSVDRAGNIDNIKSENGILKINGWAINPIKREVAKNILLFIDNEFVKNIKPSLLRKDVAKNTGEYSYLFSGFDDQFIFNDQRKTPNIRAFVLSENYEIWELKTSQNLN